MIILRERVCDWCGKTFQPKREHAITCSTACRKSRHRFGAECIPRRRADRPMVFAYADPPYPGLAARYYGSAEVDHEALLAQLVQADAWALSTSADALPDVLAMATRIERTRRVHVASWHRGDRPSRTAVRPRSAWEPVIYCGGRQSDPGDAPADALAFRAAARRSDARRIIGAKPARFAFWLFDLVGARPGDRLLDLFPGSGGIARAWAVLERGGTAADAEKEDDGAPWAPSAWLEDADGAEQSAEDGGHDDGANGQGASLRGHASGSEDRGTAVG